MTAIIGPSGNGKSTLADAFGFLADCLELGVEAACDEKNRGGFEQLRSQGCTEPLFFELYYREKGNARPITYELTIDIDESGRPYVKEERLRQRVQKTGWPLSFLHLQNGKGDAFEGTEGWQDEEGRILTGWYMRYMEGACQYVISWWFDRIKKEKVSKSKCGR